MPGLGSVSVEDLSAEIRKHTQSPLVPLMLDELKSRRIDLKEFCNRVRQVIGAEALIQTVRGLGQAQALK